MRLAIIPNRPAMQNEQVVDILEDLVRINNDRIAGYERAIGETQSLDVDLKATFDGMIRESKRYKDELGTKISELDDHAEPDEDTTISGKIYRAWMDVKATFSGNDRKTILENCEFGEDAWRRAYESALNMDDLPAEVHAMVNEQYNSQKGAHDLIKRYRDAHAAL